MSVLRKSVLCKGRFLLNKLLVESSLVSMVNQNFGNWGHTSSYSYVVLPLKIWGEQLTMYVESQHPQVRADRLPVCANFNLLEPHNVSFPKVCVGSLLQLQLDVNEKFITCLFNFSEVRRTGVWFPAGSGLFQWSSQALLCLLHHPPAPRCSGFSSHSPVCLG